MNALNAPALVTTPIARFSIETLAEVAGAKLRMADNIGNVLVIEISGIKIKLSSNGFFADDGLRCTGFKKTVQEAAWEAKDMKSVSPETVQELRGYYAGSGFKGD